MASAAAARFGLRAFRQPVMQNNLRFAGRRMNQTSAAENPIKNAMPAEAEQSGFAKLWNSPIGPKTVHFWAPIMKWGIVLAGAADFARPASQLSLSQNAALMGTGLIWTRWCFIIKPRNLFLASVNFLLFCVGTAQVSRVLMYRKSLEGPDGIKQAVKEEGKELEHAVKDPKSVEEAVAKGK